MGTRFRIAESQVWIPRGGSPPAILAQGYLPVRNGDAGSPSLL